MKLSTFNKMVVWHNATREAMGSGSSARPGTQEHYEFVVKSAELRAVGRMIDFLRDEITDV